MLKPLPNHCVIEEIKDEKKTVGGIYRAEIAQDKPAKGKVIARSPIMPTTTDFIMLEKGANWYDELKALKPGAIVAYRRWTTQEVTDTDGKKYQLATFGDLLAIYE